MKKQFIFLKKVTFISWVFICISLFILIPGRISFIHASYLGSIKSITSDFMYMQKFNYGRDLFISFTEILLFTTTNIFAGTFLLQIAIGKNKFNELSREVPFPMIGTAFVFGHLFYSSAILLLGHFYKLTPATTTSLMFLGFFIGIYPFTKLVIYSKRVFSIRQQYLSTDGYYRTLFWLCTAVMIFALFYSSTMISYDATAFYFSDEKLTALTGKIQFFQNNSFAVSAFQSGAPYAALIQVFGDQTARLYPWITGVFIILFSLAISKIFELSSQSKIILTSLVVTSTAFLDLTGDGKVDLTSTLVAISAVYWLIYNINRSSRIDFLIGLLAGFAASLRPFNTILLGGFILIFLLKQIRKNEVNRVLKAFIYIGSGAFSIATLHIYLNWLLLGNALAMINDLLHANPTNWQWTFDKNMLWAIRLFYPFSVTFINIPQSNGNISPLIVSFLPGLFIKEIREKISISNYLSSVVLAAAITLVLWVTFMFTVFEIRYVLFLWIILFIPFAKIIENILEDIQTKVFLRPILIFLLAFIVLRVISISIQRYSPKSNTGEYICRNHALCDLFEPINELAQPGDRVLVLAAYRYYLRQDLLVCSSKHDEYKLLQELSDDSSDAVWLEIYRQGYRYIVFERNYGVRHLFINFTPNPNNVPPWVDLEPIFETSRDDLMAYKFNAINPPITPEKTCIQNDLNIWEVQIIR